MDRQAKIEIIAPLIFDLTNTEAMTTEVLHERRPHLDFLAREVLQIIVAFTSIEHNFTLDTEYTLDNTKQLRYKLALITGLSGGDIHQTLLALRKANKI